MVFYIQPYALWWIVNFSDCTLCLDIDLMDNYWLYLFHCRPLYFDGTKYFIYNCISKGIFTDQYNIFCFNYSFSQVIGVSLCCLFFTKFQIPFFDEYVLLYKVTSRTIDTSCHNEPFNIFLSLWYKLMKEQVLIIIDIVHIETLLSNAKIIHNILEHPIL